MTTPLLSVVLLAAWLGAAIVVAAVVAPAAFAALPSRALAGEVIGRVLPVLFWSGMAVGLVVAALGWRAGAGVWRTGGALALVAACAAAQLVIAPRIHTLRAQIGGALESLEGSDPRRIAFGQLHGLSVAALGVGGLAALVSLLLLIRSMSSRTTP